MKGDIKYKYFFEDFVIVSAFGDFRDWFFYGDINYKESRERKITIIRLENIPLESLRRETDFIIEDRGFFYIFFIKKFDDFSIYFNANLKLSIFMVSYSFGGGKELVKNVFTYPFLKDGNIIIFSSDFQEWLKTLKYNYRDNIRRISYLKHLGRMIEDNIFKEMGGIILDEQ